MCGVKKPVYAGVAAVVPVIVWEAVPRPLVAGLPVIVQALFKLWLYPFTCLQLSVTCVGTPIVGNHCWKHLQSLELLFFNDL